MFSPSLCLLVHFLMVFLTSLRSSVIPTTGHETSIGLGGTTPPYTPFLFDGSHIPQMNPNIGSVHAFNPRSNPFTARWKTQPGRQVPSYIPTSSVPIPTNTFGMMNSLQSIRFPIEGGQSYPLGNPPDPIRLGAIFITPNPDLTWLGTFFIILNRKFMLE
jgi:hypothetical protein